MVLAGYESLATVEQVSDLGLTAMDDRQESLYLLRDMRDALDMMREKRRAPPARKARPKRLEPEKAPVDVPRPKLEAPPGMADDDPLILAGVYAKRR